MDKLATLLSELKRRRVFRVAIVYAGVAFIIFQIIDATFDYLPIPEWVGTTLIVVLLLGFPIAVGLAWAFDITGKGVVRTVAEETAGDKAPAPTETVSRPKPRYFSLSSTILGAMVLAALGYFFLIAPRLEGGEPIPTAVVDFINETNEPELNGLSGMLITALEQSRQLAVCTRSRMFDILKQLGKSNVDHIDETLGREIARQAHLEALVIASIRKFGQLYTIDMKVLDPKGDEYLFTAREEGTGQESIPAMLDRLAEKTRRGLKERTTDIEARSTNVAEVTTVNLEAYQHYFRGEEYINKLMFNQAVAEFQQAVQLDSIFGLAYYRLAYASWWTEHREVEKHALQKAVALMDRIPEKERFLLRAVRAALEEGYAAAIAVLKEMEKVYPNDKEMIYNIGDYAYHLGDFQTASLYLEKVLAMDPTFVRALQHLTWTYKDMGRYEKALEIAKRYESIIGSDESYALLNMIYFLTGSFEEAHQYAERRLSIDPTDVGARLISGDCSIYLGQIDEGFATHDHALDYARSTAEEQSVYEHRANARTYLGKYLEAEQYYQYLINYTENPPPGITPPIAAYVPHLTLAHMLRACGRFEAALLEFNKALILSPGTLRIYRDIGATYALLGNIIDAQAIADTLLKRMGVRSNRYYDHVMGYIALAQNRYVEAIQYFEHSCNEIRLPLYCMPVARALALNGDVGAAIEELVKMLPLGRYPLDPFYGPYSSLLYPYCLYTLGTLYEQTGETAKAIQTYEQLLEIWKEADEDIPELINARARHERLKSAMGS